MRRRALRELFVPTLPGHNFLKNSEFAGFTHLWEKVHDFLSQVSA